MRVAGLVSFYLGRRLLGRFIRNSREIYIRLSNEKPILMKY